MRGDPALVKTISTVDNVSTTQGQLATALTTVERLVQGKIGQYGLSAGATVRWCRRPPPASLPDI